MPDASSCREFIYSSDRVLQTPFQGWVMAIIMALLSGFAGVYTEVYSTSVAMLLTAIVSVFLFSFHLSLAFFVGSTVVSVSIYLHSIGKPQKLTSGFKENAFVERH